MKKLMLKISIVLAVIGLSVAYTFSLLSDKESAHNKLDPAYVDVQVLESSDPLAEPVSYSAFEDGTGLTYGEQDTYQKFIRIQNHDSQLNLTAAYIRVAIVATVQDDLGNVKPIDGSSYVTFNDLDSDDNWEQFGDYYYYKLPVDPKTYTEVITFDIEKPANDDLEVAVIAEGIASRQINSSLNNILDLWGVTF